jgi:hypothetical protein
MEFLIFIALVIAFIWLHFNEWFDNLKSDFDQEGWYSYLDDENNNKNKKS